MRDRFIETVEIFRLILSGKSSGRGREEVDKLMENSLLKDVYDRCQENDFLAGKWKEYKLYPPQEAYRRFLRQVRPHNIWKKMIPIGIAASVLLLLGIRILWPGQQGEIAVVAEETVIEPGIKKALLKLSDGSTVNVKGDSMHVETVDGVKIAYSDGAISYRAEEEINELVYNELIVPVAGECFITLDDGSRVWMNSDSRLRYPVRFTGEERKVFLEGEAYFDVVKDGKPFIVNTSLGDIRVLGTSFDIKAYRQEKQMLATLVSGKIRFQDGAEQVELAAGEQLVVAEGKEAVKRQVDVMEYVGWKEGWYVFKNQSLETIMTDLCRWYGVAVFYQNAGLKQITFTGNLKRYDNINTFMEVLERTGDVKYNINGKTIILFQ